jgi:hypothetical protein
LLAFFGKTQMKRKKTDKIGLAIIRVTPAAVVEICFPWSGQRRSQLADWCQERGIAPPARHFPVTDANARCAEYDTLARALRAEKVDYIAKTIERIVAEIRSVVDEYMEEKTRCS